MIRPLSIAKAFLCACVWMSAAAVAPCFAQQATASGREGQTPVFTLKVYANLVQIPTLVLDHDRQSLPPIDSRRFQVSLDGGKRFAPTHVRREGEDPLDLAVLIDVGGKERNDLVPAAADALSRMAATSLLPRDRISIYILSCNLLRVIHEAPPDPALLERAIENGLDSPQLGKNSAGASCGANVYLWGALIGIVSEMNDAAGRGAILAISNGQDDGSSASWKKVHDYAAAEGVAVFGLRDGNDLWPASQRNDTDDLGSLCESTGGIVLHGGKREMKKRLVQWIGLLRGRYVVEFPRPQLLTKGKHDIAVTIKRDGLAFITLAGVSVSLPDPKLIADPHYIPSDEGSDIPIGKGRPPSN